MKTNKDEEVLICCICKNDQHSSAKFGLYQTIDSKTKENLENHFKVEVRSNSNICNTCALKMENKTKNTRCIDCEEFDTKDIHNRCKSCAEIFFIKTTKEKLALNCPICKEQHNDYQKIQKHLKNQHQKKEITLEVWINLSLKNLKFIEKRPYSEITTRLVEEHLFQKKYPLVFTNTIKCLNSKPILPTQFTHQQQTFDLFSLNFLKYKFGDTEIYPRNTDTLEEFPNWKMKDYVEFLESKERSKQHLYGKDLPCPKEWSSYIFENEQFPEMCKWLGKLDCFTCLEEKLRPLTLLNYIGYEGTNTPAHKDICASIGNNVMVDVEDEKSYSLWKLFHPKDYQLIECYLKKYFKSSLDHDNCFLTTTFLSCVPFETIIFEQKLGDYIIIPPNSPHQVENFGGHGTKIAWNTMLPKAIPLAYDTLEVYRTIGKQQIFRIKAMAYYSLEKLMNSVSDLLFDLEDSNLLTDFDALIQTVTKIIQSEYITKKDDDPTFKVKKFHDITPHERVCDYCKQDIFNRCYHCSECGIDDGVDFCLPCVAFGRGCIHRRDLKLMEFIPMRSLLHFLESAKQKQKNASILFASHLKNESLKRTETEKFVPPINSPGTLSFKKVQSFQKDRINICHQCKEKKQIFEVIQCSNDCPRYFCESCLWNRYASKLIDCLKINWTCPVCESKCNCDTCSGRNGSQENELKRMRDVESFNDIAIAPVNSLLIQSVSDSSPNPNKYKKTNQSNKVASSNSSSNGEHSRLIDSKEGSVFTCTVCSNKIPKDRRLYRCEKCDEDRCKKCLSKELLDDICEHNFVKYNYACDNCEKHIMGVRYHTSNDDDFCQNCYLAVRTEKIIAQNLTVTTYVPRLYDITKNVEL
eukprot:gene10100-2520_t